MSCRKTPCPGAATDALGAALAQKDAPSLTFHGRGAAEWIAKRPLVWLPPKVQGLLFVWAGDRVRSCVRPLRCGLSGAAGRYGDLRNRSKSSTRALRLEGSDWFSGSRSVRSFCPCGLSPSHTFFTGFGPWHSAQMSRSHGPLRIPIFLASRQHGPDHAGHLVGQGDRHQDARLARQHPRQPRPFGDGFAPKPVQPRHRADDQKPADRVFDSSPLHIWYLLGVFDLPGSRFSCYAPSWRRSDIHARRGEQVSGPRVAGTRCAGWHCRVSAGQALPACTDGRPSGGTSSAERRDSPGWHQAGGNLPWLVKSARGKDRIRPPALLCIFQMPGRAEAV